MNLILAPNVCCVVFLRKEMDKRKECVVFVLLVRRCGTCGEKKAHCNKGCKCATRRSSEWSRGRQTWIQQILLRVGWVWMERTKVN